MGPSLSMLKEYCHNVKEIGSLVPDSKACVNSLLKYVPFSSANVIVEFGSASGAVTREIIARKRPDTIFVAFEKNRTLHSAFATGLARENVYLVNEDVSNCAKVLDVILGIKGKIVDCIVSTLPCSCVDFNAIMQGSVLPVLKSRGQFVQYMHTLSLLKGFNLYNTLIDHFNNVISEFVLFNMPPALIYTCDTVQYAHTVNEYKYFVRTLE